MIKKLNLKFDIINIAFNIIKLLYDYFINFFNQT